MMHPAAPDKALCSGGCVTRILPERGCPVPSSAGGPGEGSGCSVLQILHPAVLQDTERDPSFCLVAVLDPCGVSWQPAVLCHPPGTAVTAVLSLLLQGTWWSSTESP